jgi:nucleoside-diphosphate-sugar epimerase
MGQVLITGGAGFLGQHVVRELLADGASVRALSRRPETDATLAALGAQPVRGDVTDLDSLRAALVGVDTVFHTAADTNTWRPNNAAQTRTNVGGASNLVQAARDAGVTAFIHTSSVSAYSHLVHTPLREDTPQRGGESWVNYERTKFQAEQIVRGSGLPFVILQPAHIFGPGDTHNWSRLIGLVDRGELPGVPPGTGSFADVREIAKAQVQAWRQQRFGEAYLLGGEQASFLELIGKIGAILGRPVPKRATPEFALRLVARLMYAKSLLTRRAPQITPEAAEFTCHKLSVDSGKAIAQLGYRLTPLQSLLEDTVTWMRAGKMLG